MRGKKALLGAVLVVAALAALALVLPISAPGLGREVEERVRSATGIPLEVSRARVLLLRGLVLEDVRMVAGSYRAHIPRMVLEQGPLALLGRRRELDGIHLEECRVDFDGGSISIEELRLRLSRFDYDSRALTPLHGLGSEGYLTLRRIAFGERALRDLAARMTIERGRVRLDDLRLATERGETAGELALDFNSFPFRYRASLESPSFEVEGLGRGTLRLDAEGFGAKRRDLKGTGVFELEGGVFPDASWIREIDPALAGAEHAPIEIAFEVRDERFHVETFQVEVGERVLEVEGSFGLDGSRDVRATEKRARESSPGPPRR